MTEDEFLLDFGCEGPRRITVLVEVKMLRHFFLLALVWL